MKTTTNTGTYGINWKNVDLTNRYERDQNLLDPYDFDTLLLEVNCNLKTINHETVRAQAMESIKAKYKTAIEILDANLNNIVKEALKERNS